MNNVELQGRFKAGVLDCLFSPAFFAAHEGPSARVREVCLLILPTTSPSSCFSVSIGDRICMTVTRNSGELDAAAMTAEANAVWRSGAEGRALREDLTGRQAASG